jgi:hypothetical protein
VQFTKLVEKTPIYHTANYNLITKCGTGRLDSRIRIRKKPSGFAKLANVALFLQCYSYYFCFLNVCQNFENKSWPDRTEALKKYLKIQKL